MKLLIDMNLSPGWVQFLNGRGLEALHWATVGDPKASDETIVAYAKNHRFAILTQDLDFGAILAASGENGPSVIQIRSPRPSFERAGALVVEAVRHLTVELEAGALVTVDADRIRVSILPLQGMS